jgi:hypothetical protein
MYVLLEKVKKKPCLGTELLAREPTKQYCIKRPPSSSAYQPSASGTFLSEQTTTSNQPAVLFSQNKPATGNQPAVLFS